MEQNVGKIDRTIRFFVGVVTLYLSATYSIWWLVLAIPALITTFTGFCWPYKLLGINTAKKVVAEKIKPKKKKL